MLHACVTLARQFNIHNFFVIIDMYRKYKYLKAQLIGNTVKKTQLSTIPSQSSGLHKEKENERKDEVFGTFLNKKHFEQHSCCNDRTKPASCKARKWVPGHGFKTVLVSKEKPIDEGKKSSDVGKGEVFTTHSTTRLEEASTERVSQKVTSLVSSEV